MCATKSLGWLKGSLSVKVAMTASVSAVPSGGSMYVPCTLTSPPTGRG
jgi:hypothetical protein